MLEGKDRLQTEFGSVEIVVEHVGVTWSDSKVMRLIFSWLYWQYCGPPTRTDFDLGPSSILTCNGMAVQCFSVQ